MRRLTAGLLPLTVANIKSFYRDPASLFWTFAFPIIFVVLFGSIFSGGGGSFNVGWVDEDRSAASQQLRESFAEVPILVLKDSDQAAALEEMRDGTFDAVVVVPAGLGAAMTPDRSGPPFQLTLYTDPSRSTASTTVTQIVAQVVNGINLSLAGVPPALGIAGQALQTQNISAAAYFVPSILAMALMQLGVFAAIPLVAQREKGILKRLNATPLSRSTLVASNVLMRLLIAIMQTVIIVGIGVVAFGVTVIGSLFVVAGFIVLGAVTFLALGYVIAAYARTEESANALTSVVQFPLMFLSGIFFPIDFMPDWLQPVASIMPLTYLGDALRQTMVGGAA
ncbi:MAG: ABC transporter permease, partial [Candidatus Limnocylindrales bacterium]